MFAGLLPPAEGFREKKISPFLGSTLVLTEALLFVKLGSCSPFLIIVK